jgi:hypothetical protein
VENLWKNCGKVLIGALVLGFLSTNETRARVLHSATHLDALDKLDSRAYIERGKGRVGVMKRDMTQCHNLTAYIEPELFTNFLRDFIKRALAKAYCPENPEHVNVDVRCTIHKAHDLWYEVNVFQYEPMRIPLGHSDTHVPEVVKREFTFRANTDGILMYFQITISAYAEPETLKLMALSAEKLLRATGLNAIVMYDW